MTFGETTEDIARRIVNCQDSTNDLVASEINQKRQEQVRTDMTRLIGMMPGESQQEKEANANELIAKVKHKGLVSETDVDEQVKKWLK